MLARAFFVMRAALIIGVGGEALTAAERSFLADARPAGIILFARNCSSKAQVRRLVEEAKSAVGAPLLVLIDQEGGRVRRLRPPEWRDLPAAAAYGRVFAREPALALRRAWLVARLTAEDLREIGVNANCAPVLDVPQRQAHPIIGDRAYADAPATVAALGRAVAEGLLAGGVLPIIKHMPGHGRARVDSHLELPVVETARAELEASDFVPFKALSGMPAAMTAHVVYTAIDPTAPASTSPDVTRDVIRGAIGFHGLLMSDDIGMGALSGDFRSRAEAVVNAGSDIALHCSGNVIEAQLAASGAGRLAGEALERYLRAVAVQERTGPFDAAEAVVALGEMLQAMA
ncbi:MAG TPA: beta-N-acetylhexosaminidase [Hyphomicrobiaceae bacterium]|nr:beta-N-acetylhexosaminidase [Hyphomicrobiaceae bacterium]